MVARNRALGFCLSPALHSTFRTSSQFSGTIMAKQRRPQSPSSPRRSAAQAAAMSLANDLIVKGLEVGVATFLGNAVAVQQKLSPPPPPKRGFFRSHRKKARSKPKPVATSLGVEPAQVRGLVTELVRLAEGLPEVLERGGPEGKKWVKLAICIGIDLVGSGSLGVPLLGDALDLVTAPLSAVMLQALFGSTLVTMGGLAEELLPGTDGIPTATLAWLAEYYGYLNAEQDGRTG